MIFVSGRYTYVSLDIRRRLEGRSHLEGEGRDGGAGAAALHHPRAGREI